MSIDYCRNLAHSSGNTIFGLTYREKIHFYEGYDFLRESRSEKRSGTSRNEGRGIPPAIHSWKSYPIKCVVADTEDDMLNAGESDTCSLQYYHGSITAISFFRVVDPPTNHVYPFEGLRTMNDAKEFCKTQGASPKTKFGLDDNGAQTEGV